MADDEQFGSQPSHSSAEVLREAAMRGEADRYLAATLAPRVARPGLIALAAFAADLGRIAPSVTEPMLGAMRFQWWRDALETGARGAYTGYPVADALGAALRGSDPGRTAALALIEARERELDPIPRAGEGELLRQLDATEGRTFSIALLLLGVSEAAAGPLAHAAGRAYGLARCACDTRVALASRRELALAALAEARSLRAALPRASGAATLPLAMVGPYLRLESLGSGTGRGPETSPGPSSGPSPLARLARIGLAHVTGRL